MLAPGMSAANARERLVVFVENVVCGLAHPRQRENAGLYVRGLIEQGGRKSLQPTLFRLGEPPARYESLQQFLADSPWDPALLVAARPLSCSQGRAATSSSPLASGSCQATSPSSPTSPLRR